MLEEGPMQSRSIRAVAIAGGAFLATLAIVPAVGAQDTTSVVAFVPTRTNNYIAEWINGAQEEADRQGIEITFIENNFDQAEQNAQVQTQLAAGDPPDAYVWWPADNAGGVATLQALAATGVPVIQTNQLPAAEAAGSWVAYAGVDDTLNGTVAGELLLAARDSLVDAGTLTLHGDGGNAIAITFPAGYQAGIDRMTGFHSVADPAGIVVLAEEPAGFDAATGYTAAQGLITAHREAGIDMVYAQNDALADGAIQALEEAGYTPGTDVAVVGGTCHGKLDNLESGKQYATGLQAARYEGVFSVNAIARYLATGEVEEGAYAAPGDADALPEFPANISQYNFIPNPGVLAGDIDSTSLWGKTLRELCTY
jgi:ribose transport system substrate-binding protein